jgi:hypothetical protein
MRKNELNSPIVPPDDYAAAVQEAQRLRLAKQREFHGLDPAELYDEEVAWQANDTYLQAAKERLQTTRRLLDDDTRQTLRDRAEREHAAWVENRDRCRREVRMLEKLGEPVPEDLRRLAEEPDLWQQIEAAATEMTEGRQRTLRRVMST